MGTPTIINHSRSAGIGDIIFLQGSEFGASPLVQYSHDDSNWQSLVQINCNNGSITAQLPISDTKLPDLLTVRISGDGGVSWSQPVFLNKADARFFSADAVAPGSIFKIFGDNLSLGRPPTVRLTDQATGDSLSAAVDTNRSTNYMLVATAPAVLTGHVYAVSVSNGFYGNSSTAVESMADERLSGINGGSDDWQLGVPWAADLAVGGNSYNVTSDPRLGGIFAMGDGVANDLWPINHAIQVAANAGGGVVYLPSGIYAVKFDNGCGVQLLPHVVLAGAGASQVRMNYGYDAGTLGGYAVCFSSYSGLFGLTVNNVDTQQKWQWSGYSGGNSEVFVKNVVWNLATSQWLNFLGDDHVLISASTINQGLDSAFQNLGPLNMSNCAHCEVNNSVINFTTCGILLDGSSDIIFDGNQIVRDVSISPAPDTVTHSIAANFVKGFAVTGNTFSSVGGGNPTNNDGEVINTEAGGAVRVDEFRGTVTSSGGSSITDSGQNFFKSANASSSLRAGVATIYIISGNGLGQYRLVSSISGDGHTVLVDRPWDVQPDSGSHYATFDWSAKNWVIAQNALVDNFKGLEFFQASIHDILIQGNTFSDSDGIMISPDEHDTKAAPALFNVISDVRIIGNSLLDTKCLRPAYVGLLPREDTQIAPFGTSMIGIDVSANNVSGCIPNVFNAPVSWDDYKVVSEGYLASYYWQSASAYDQSTALPSILSPIFQQNMATNSKATFYFDSGTSGAVMADTIEQKTGMSLQDEPIYGASSGSQGTSMIRQLKIFPVGLGLQSNDSIQSVSSSTGQRGISMTHVGSAPYGISSGGDTLSLLGLKVANDSVVTAKVSLTVGSTATGYLIVRNTPLSNSAFVGVGLAAGSIVLQTRLANGGPVEINTFPFQTSAAFLKLVKTGESVSAMYSSDGIAWNSMSVHFETSGRLFLIGIAETSLGDASTNPELTFEGLTFSAGVNASVATSAIRGPGRVRRGEYAIENAVLAIFRKIRHGLAVVFLG